MICKAIYVSTGKELAVEERLKKIEGISIINPCQTKLKVNKNKKTSLSYNNLLKGYLLIEVKDLTDELYHRIKQTSGVIRILEGLITDEELNLVRDKLHPIVEIEIIALEESTTSNAISKDKVTEIIKNAKKIYVFPLHLFKKSFEKNIVHKIKEVIEKYNSNYTLVKYLKAMLV